MEASAQDVTAIRAEVDALRASSGDDDEVTLNTGLSYLAGHPVRIRVRKRGSRYDITDGASAVDLAGRPDGWLATASDTAARTGMNVNRRGVAFVTGFEQRDVADLVTRLADARALSMCRSLSRLTELSATRAVSTEDNRTRHRTPPMSRPRRTPNGM